MPKPTPAIAPDDRVDLWIKRVIWLVCFPATLAISGWSIFWIFDHWGLPWYLSAVASACTDGVAIYAAQQSLSEIQDGARAGRERLYLLAFVLAGAWINHYHAIALHQPPIAQAGWAVPTLAAAALYDMKHRKAKRIAVAKWELKTGEPYPDAASWLVAPFQVWRWSRAIVLRRIPMVPAAGVERVGIKGGREVLENAFSNARSVAGVTGPVASVSGAVSTSVSGSVTGAGVTSVPGVTSPAQGTVAYPVAGAASANVTESPATAAQGPGEVPDGTDAGPEVAGVTSAQQSPVTTVTGSRPASVAGQRNGSVAGQRNQRTGPIGVVRNCDHCGNAYTAQTQASRFCSPTHRVAWNRANKKAAGE